MNQEAARDMSIYRIKEHASETSDIFHFIQEEVRVDVCPVDEDSEMLLCGIEDYSCEETSEELLVMKKEESFSLEVDASMSVDDRECCSSENFNVEFSSMQKEKSRTMDESSRMPITNGKITQHCRAGFGTMSFTVPSAPSSQVFACAAGGSAAVNAVFQTYELLEKVLQNLSMLDLLRDQRVSKDWRDIIKSSRPLQKKLFMVPAPQPPDENLECQNYNPLLLSRCLISHIDRRFSRGPIRLVQRARSPIPQRPPPPLDQLNFRIPSNAEPEASWRKMFLTQPPLAGVRIEVSVYGEILRAGELDPTRPLRLGDIVENPGYDMCGHVTGNGRECRTGIIRVAELNKLF
jgi:hypothetical protein